MPAIPTLNASKYLNSGCYQNIVNVPWYVRHKGLRISTVNEGIKRFAGKHEAGPHLNVNTEVNIVFDN